jgi:uncharacterized protein (DUF952 family)
LPEREGAEAPLAHIMERRAPDWRRISAVPSPDHATFHMLPRPAWVEARATGWIVPASLAAEGFVHCTDGAGPLIDTANRHYADVPGSFVALTVDLARVAAPWRYDDPARIYPHVYGPLPIGAIDGVRVLARDGAGRFRPFPEAAVNRLEPLLDRMAAAGAQLASTRQAVDSRAPWAVGALEAGGVEASWGPTEILAHVAEMLQYWLGEAERVLAGADGRGGGGPAPFGRTPADPVRTLMVIRDATLPPRELYARIAASLQRYRWRLPELTEDELARTGVHPVRGELSVGELVERFAVSHLEEHAAQMEDVLRA